MKIKSQRDFWSGLMFLGTGIGFTLAASYHPIGSAARPGPGLLPLGLGLLVAALGALLTFKSLVIETDDGDPLGRWAWRPLLAVTGGVAAFGWLLPRLGLPGAAALLAAVVGLGSTGLSRRRVLVAAAAAAPLAWLVLVQGIGLPLPLWPVGRAG